MANFMQVNAAAVSELTVDQIRIPKSDAMQ